MATPVRVDFHFYGTLQREGSWWVAHCPSLDVASQGETRERAQANLREAVQMFIESCSARGTLFDALHELGFAPGCDRPAPEDSFPVDVPLTFSASADAACHV